MTREQLDYTFTRLATSTVGNGADMSTAVCDGRATSTDRNNQKDGVMGVRSSGRWRAQALSRRDDA